MKASICEKLKATGGQTEALVKVSEKIHKRKRDLENRARKVKDHAKRNIKSAMKTLHTLRV